VAMGLDGPDTSEETLAELHSRDALIDHLHDTVDVRLEAKSAEVGEADWSLVERLVLLRTIDSLWVEHLTELDDMRRGIGLRGYAQQDPLNEFKKEAFSLYEELRSLIRHQVATTIFRVTVTRNAAPTPAAQEAQLASDLAAGAAAVRDSGTARRATAGAASGGAAASAGASAATAGAAATTASASAAASPRIGGSLPAGPSTRGMVESLGDETVARGTGGNGALRPGFTPSGVRIGRNDPCFCGSGLKYKKCHGR